MPIAEATGNKFKKQLDSSFLCLLYVLIFNTHEKIEAVVVRFFVF